MIGTRCTFIALTIGALTVAGCAAPEKPPPVALKPAPVVTPLASALPADPLPCDPAGSDSPAKDAGKLSEAFDQRQTCRAAEASKTRAAFKAGQVARADAAAAMILLRGRARQDIVRTRAALRRTAAAGSDIAAFQARLVAAERAAVDLGKLDT